MCNAKKIADLLSKYAINLVHSSADCEYWWVTIVEFLGESGQIHILGYILKKYFDTLLDFFESELSKLGHFQSLESIFRAKYMLDLLREDFLSEFSN